MILEEHKNELESCPFCGNDAEIKLKERAYSICSDPYCCGMGDLILIECTNCYCEMKYYSPYSHKRKEDVQAAISAWNNRC